jgi:hypothetical protein
MGVNQLQRRIVARECRLGNLMVAASLRNAGRKVAMRNTFKVPKFVVLSWMPASAGNFPGPVATRAAQPSDFRHGRG